MAKLVDFESKTFDATSLTGSFQNLGAVLSEPAIVLTLYNTSDVDVIVTKDGSTSNWIIPTLGTLTVDSREASSSQDPDLRLLPKSAQLKVKQVTGAGTSGDIIANITTLAL